VTDPNGPMPSPPFPKPDSDALWLIVQNTMREYEEGVVGVRGAVLHAAVHGWFEGHLEGEDSCPGCDFRGELGERGILREIWLWDTIGRPRHDEDSE
jgi:hypothetical protein